MTMAVRIAELPTIDQITKDSLIIVQDGEATKKVTIQQLKDGLGASKAEETLNALGLSVDSEGYIVQEVED